ncbi:MAG: AEC family transporter [Kiritimatiellae bacterium]|nr:AEC family transporter [Kiritimatiellia bacterium]
MLESFLVAFNAVMPLLILLGIGYGAVRLKLTDRPFMDRLNATNFRLFFPFLMFNNIYNAKPEDLPSAALMAGAPAAILLLIAVLLLLVPRVVKENPRRGVIIQAIFRSNFIIYGIPLTTYVFGPEKASVCGMMVMIVVSLFNIMSVVVLELFREGGKVRPGHLLLGIVKNPLLQGCVAGLLFFALRLRLPAFIASPVSSLSTLASTLALVVLGANLRFSEIKKNIRPISAVLGIRLVILPLVMLSFAWLAGLRGVELFLVLMIFGTPVATSSYPMAQNMGGDGLLAGQLVFTSTVCSLGTIFAFIFALSRLGLLL